MRQDYQTSEEEKGILAVTRELIGQFNPKAAPPTMVSWQDHHGKSYTILPSDTVLIYLGVEWSFLTLPKRMMGRLDPEEWKPIIASSMIYYGSFHRSLSTQMILKVALPILPVVGVIVYLLSVLGSRFLGGVILTITLATALVVGMLRTAPILRKGWLTADVQAAKALGKESLLKTLSKIDAMGLKDIESLKSGNWRTSFAPRPSITARIENLQQYASLS